MVSHYMSGWSKGALDAEPDPRQIAAVMVEFCGAEILSIRSAPTDGFSIILFREQGDDRIRALRCVSGKGLQRVASDVPGPSGAGVAVMDEGGVREIVRRLVETYGGWFQASDLVGGSWERIEPPADRPKAP